MLAMVFIKTEGKFNNNSFLIDAQMFGMRGNATIYIIENRGTRMMIDTTTPALMIRRIVNKIKELGLYPIHKLLLTHSHWDHIKGVGKLKTLMKDTEIEVLASQNAIYNLKHPEKMNKEYEVNIDPIENVLPLNEGDIIDLNGLELEIINFFGHTQDLIAILDKKNKNIIAGDAVINKYDKNTFLPVFLSHEFNEKELLKTFEKLRSLKAELKGNLNSISISHFGVWKDKEFDLILNQMEDLHYQTKNSIIQWYKETSSLDYITMKYFETFIPHSTLFTKENLSGLKLAMEWLVDGLKISGFL
jgi:glyoxylase-like metal-dependent hydrolase (beta-lactamase superfamily II)